MRELSPQAQDKFTEARLRIRGFFNVERLWTRHLTPAQRVRLGGDVDEVWNRYGNAAKIWRALHGVSIARAVLDVALALGHMSEADHRWLRSELDDPVDPDEAVESAIAQNGLVLRESPRELHWKGRQAEIEWETQSASWEFLWTLARAAKSGEGVSQDDCGGRSKVAQRKYRLRNLAKFPSSLAALIQPYGRGEQRLQLPPQSVRIFECEPGGGLREWFPSATRRTAR